jgi:hypothetical protein
VVMAAVVKLAVVDVVLLAGGASDELVSVVVDGLAIAVDLDFGKGSFWLQSYPGQFQNVRMQHSFQTSYLRGSSRPSRSAKVCRA